MSDTERRRRQVRDLIARNEIRTQEQLLALLAAEGVTTTQATLSRDMRELGARKRGGIYRIAAPARAAARRRRIARSLRGVVERADRSGGLVVLHTRAGMAQAVATELAAGELDEVLGTIAGVDTVFVATPTASHARGLMRLVGAT